MTGQIPIIGDLIEIEQSDLQMLTDAIGLVGDLLIIEMNYAAVLRNIRTRGHLVFLVRGPAIDSPFRQTTSTGSSHHCHVNLTHFNKYKSSN